SVLASSTWILGRRWAPSSLASTTRSRDCSSATTGGTSPARASGARSPLAESSVLSPSTVSGLLYTRPPPVASGAATLATAGRGGNRCRPTGQRFASNASIDQFTEGESSPPKTRANDDEEGILRWSSPYRGRVRQRGRRSGGR